MPESVDDRFRHEHLELSGIVGIDVEVPSANPVNHHQAITDPVLLLTPTS